MSRQQKAASITSALLLLIGIVDVGLRLWLDWPRGASGVIHDPGQHFFHVVLLPAAMWMVITFWPTGPQGLWAGAGKFQRRFLIFLAAVLVAIAGWAAYDDASNRLCNGSVPPADIGNNDVRMSLLDKKDELYKGLAKVLSIGQAKLDPMEAEDAVTQYRKILDEARTNCDVWAVSSIRFKFAMMFETFIAIVCGASIVWQIAAYVLLRSRPDPPQLATFTVVILIFSLWMPLRSYSEWYSNFGALHWQTYPPIFAAAVVIAIASIFTVFLAVRRSIGRNAALAAGSFVSITVGITAALKPVVLQNLAAGYLQMGAMPRTVILFFVGLMTIGLVWYFSGPDIAANLIGEQEGGPAHG